LDHLYVVFSIIFMMPKEFYLFQVVQHPSNHINNLLLKKVNFFDHVRIFIDSYWSVSKSTNSYYRRRGLGVSLNEGTSKFLFSVGIQMVNSSSEQEDTVLPSPEVLCSRLLSPGKIWEEGGESTFL